MIMSISSGGKRLIGGRTVVRCIVPRAWDVEVVFILSSFLRPTGQRSLGRFRKICILRTLNGIMPDVTSRRDGRNQMGQQSQRLQVTKRSDARSWGPAGECKCNDLMPSQSTVTDSQVHCAECEMIDVQ